MNLEKLFFWRDPATAPKRVEAIRAVHDELLQASLKLSDKADMLKQDLARLALKAAVKP